MGAPRPPAGLVSDWEEPGRGAGRLRLLFVVPFGPRFDSKHGGRVIAQLLDQLVERHDVAVVYQRQPGTAPIDSGLARRSALVREVPLPASVPSGSPWAHQKRVLRALAGGPPASVSAIYSRQFAAVAHAVASDFAPDVVQVEHDALGYCLAAVAMAGAARILVCHDPGLDASRDLVAVTRGRRRIVHQIDVAAWRRYWSRTLSEADLVITFTREDAQSVAPYAGHTAVEAIPLGIDVPTTPDDPIGTDPPSVIFVGGYVHPPNADAAMRLMSSIMPAVRRERAGLELILVGDRPTRGMLHAAAPHDRITGPVPSVGPYRNAAAILVLPIRLGGGMRVKLLEGLAAGKAIVASPLAAAGLDVRDGTQLRLATTDAEFAAAILELLADPEQRRRLAATGRAWAEQNLSWESRVARYEDVYRRLTDQASGH